MFCEEEVEEVYELTPDVPYSDEECFFDCCHDIAYHCTKAYKLVLKTKNYYLTLGYDGVRKYLNEEEFVSNDVYLEPTIYNAEYDKVPWVDFKHTFFVGERLVDIKDDDGYYCAVFDDFTLKIIPYNDGKEIKGCNNKHCGSYNYVYGCERWIKRKCDCGGRGEVLLDFVDDYVVRCNKCKKSTWARMNLIDAIEDWNAGYIRCDLGDIVIE